MPTVEHVDMHDVARGRHATLPEGAALIQVVDPDMDWPTPMAQFRYILRLKFLDIDPQADDTPDTWAMSESQARAVDAFLAEALREGRNVLVHCVHGSSRSGAIAAHAQSQGFECLRPLTEPNAHVLRALRRVHLALGRA